MSNQFIYHSNGHKVVEVNDWSHPDTIESIQHLRGIVYFDIRIKEYEEHIASLKEYPCHESCKWKDGQVLEEGKDFEVEEVERPFPYTPTFITIAYPLPQVTESKFNFLAVLEENYQAQIAGFYNIDKTDEERKIRNAVITEYQDLIAIYKSKQQHFTIKRNQ